jgi:hypothetical protein
MQPQILFDATETPFDYVQAAVLLLLAGCVLFWLALSLLRNGGGGLWPALTRLGLGVAALLAMSLPVRDWFEHRALQDAAAGGPEARVIDGVVRDHRVKEEPVESGERVQVRTVERFRVAGISFKFAQTAALEPYFTNAREHPIEIRDGQRLRIVYVEEPGAADRRIVRLEIVPPAQNALNGPSSDPPRAGTWRD